MPDPNEGFVLEFYRQQHDALVRYLGRKLGSAAEANDVAQQTYMRLLNSDQVNQINNPKAFVYKMATNLAIDTLRKRKRLDDVSDYEIGEQLDTLPGGETSPDEVVVAEQTIELIQRFITELPPKCRYAFLSYKFEELDYQEIADLLDVSESMIRKYVLRAVQYCRNRLEQNESSAEISSRYIAK